MTYYTYAERGHVGRYSVAKSDEYGGEPIEVYEIIYNEFNKVCTCPSHKQPCKHMKWFEDWRVFKEPHLTNVYNDDNSMWMTNPFAPDEETAKIINGD